MKQRHHPVSDDPSRVACDHRSVMKGIAREQSLVTQLRAIVLPALQPDERSELVAQMFQNILDCSSKAMAELQLLHQSDDGTLVDDKRRLIRRIPDDFNSNEDVNKPHHRHKRRYACEHVISLVCCCSQCFDTSYVIKVLSILSPAANHLSAGDLLTRCHLKRPFHTTMAANGGNMGKRKSTKKNTQGKFFVPNLKKCILDSMF
jgi:hypothetical protein